MTALAEPFLGYTIKYEHPQQRGCRSRGNVHEKAGYRATFAPARSGSRAAFGGSPAAGWHALDTGGTRSSFRDEITTTSIRLSSQCFPEGLQQGLGLIDFFEDFWVAL